MQQIEQQQQLRQQALKEEVLKEANSNTIIDNTDFIDQLFSAGGNILGAGGKIGGDILGIGGDILGSAGQFADKNLRLYQKTKDDGLQTSPFFDLLRVAAANNKSPQVSKFFESEVASERAKVKASSDLLAKLQKEQTRLAERAEDDKIDELEADGKVTTARAKLIRERADKFDKMPSFKAISEGLREVNNSLTLIKSDSKFSFDTLVNQLIRMSGDKRINEADRKAFSSSLGLKDGMTQKAMKKVLGGTLTKATKDEALKLIESATSSMRKNANNLINGERKLLELDGTLEQTDIDELVNTLKLRYGLPQSQVQAQPEQQGQIMVDANGNRARVFPDGTFEEIE